MSSQQTLLTPPKPTSSPGSASGPTRSGSLGGPMTEKCGPAPVRASRFLPPVVVEASRILATSGPSGSGSFASAVLQSSLESRLRAELAGRGSTLYRMTWKAWDMPSGRRLCRLVASAHRTSGSGCSSWPTPTKALATKGVRSEKGAIIECARKHGPDLAAVSVLAGWPTPTKQDAANAANATATRHNPDSKHHAGVTLVDASRMAGWATPTKSDGHGSGKNQNSKTLDRQIKNEGRPLQEQVVSLASGATANGSPVQTGGQGQLNPALPRWLMGLPEEWDEASPGFQAWLVVQEVIASGG